MRLFPSKRPSPVGAPGFAVLWVGIALALRFAMHPVLGVRQPFVTFYIAIALATFWGGFRAGLLALLLSYLAGDWFFVPPDKTLSLFSRNVPDVVEGATHLLAGASIVFVIAQARAAHARARAQRELLEAVLQQMPVGVIVAEAPDGRQIICNDLAERLWGRPPLSGSFGEPAQARGFHMDGRPYERNEWPLFRSLKSGERIKDQEILLLRPDGTKIVMRISSSPVLDRVGHVVSAVNSFEDITERKRYQEAQARLASIVESSDDGIISLDPDGIIRTWNRGAEQIYGYLATEIIGKSVSLVIPAEHSAEKDGLLQKLNGGQRVHYLETVRLRKDGTTFDVGLTISPLFDSRGVVTGISSIIRDITERKQMEKALREAQTKLQSHADDLEKEVAIRTAAMRETIDSLEGICYHIAHDLRAPLRSLEGFSCLLLKSASSLLNDHQKEMLQRIAASVVKMDHLTTDLLNYGRIGHISLPCSWEELDHIFRAVLVDLSSEIEGRAATVELLTPMPKVWVNRMLVKQILSNLVNNALKYVAPGVAPQVRVWAEESETISRIFVEDNGIGIAPEFHQRIFKVFTRLHSEKDYAGTGMGLAIVQKGVQRMGGNVSVHSQLGQGSCFCLVLPKQGASMAVERELNAPGALSKPYEHQRSVSL